MSGTIRTKYFTMVSMAAIPWQIKILAKLMLSRLPAGYDFWQKLAMFRHGAMDKPEYAFSVFEKHWRESGLQAGPDVTVLELGPGDSLASGLIGHAFGVGATYLVDVGNYISDKIEPYLQLHKLLTAKGLPQPDREALQDLAAVQSIYNIKYGYQGLASLKDIPDQSVDLIWSQAVLEHLRLHEFDDHLLEMRRILKPTGLCSHHIDLKDHLGGSLNNLRFSNNIWEAEWMASSGFYTNRIRYSSMIKRFEQAGFQVEVVRVGHFPTLQIPVEKLAPEFQKLTAEELAVNRFKVLLRPAGRVG